ncbi:autotransporter [Ancylobacter sonchi]
MTLIASGWIAAPGPAAAQATCEASGSGYSCSIPGGSYSSPITVTEPGDAPSCTALTVNNAGAIDIGVGTAPTSSVGVYALGASLTGDNAVNTGDASGLTVVNTGAITLGDGASAYYDYSIFGIWAQQAAGGLGSTTAAAEVFNYNSITLAPSSAIQVEEAFGIWVSDQGGATFGNSYGASVYNDGAITVTAIGQQGAAGIDAFSIGAYLGTAGSDSGFGGIVSVINAAPVTVDWTWQNVGNNSGVFGIQAISTGSNGVSFTSTQYGTGGDGIPAGASGIVLNAGGDVTVTANGTPRDVAVPGLSILNAVSPGTSLQGAGLFAATFGGNGGSGFGYQQPGGNGAEGGPVRIAIEDASVTTTGSGLPALALLVQAGAGGVSGCQSFNDCSFWQSGTYSPEGNGGAGGDVYANADSSIQIVANTVPVTISTNGDNSAGILALMQGGTGAAGGLLPASGTAGAGGAGGNVHATLNIGLTGANQPLAVLTQGTNSPGISASSLGGEGSAGAEAANSLDSITAGAGGNGGDGGAINVRLTAASVTTLQDQSVGIYLLSQGGSGGAGGLADGGTIEQHGGDGGDGGSAGDLTVTLDPDSAITTYGLSSSAIVATSISGGGGDGGDASGGHAHAGTGGSGGNAGNVSVDNAGAITTHGASARGIVAQSIAGSGGGGGYSYGVFKSTGGTGAAAGTTGSVSVSNSGTITTYGSNAHGALLQSIGGGGGAGGQAGGSFDTIGGSASDTPHESDGGDVLFTSDGGSIVTDGFGAFGVLGQSIGGGGGDGGGAAGGNVVIGGNGGAGGTGGTVTAHLNAGTEILALDDGSAGVVMQSIGGGGGNGGNASADSIFTAAAVGGKAGGGGDGGAVTVNAYDSSITTAGTKAPGILAQSIGGGGGAGGWAISTAVSAGIGVASAIGGAGGTGGDASTSTVTLAGTSVLTGLQIMLLGEGIVLDQSHCTDATCNMLPVDSYGVVVQSIGGGGGMGGAATAQSLVLAIPTPSGDQIGVSVSLAVGGSGGDGGDGSTAQFFQTQGSTIATYGQGSAGVLAQSIGGGGGVGGDSSANAAVLGYDVPGDATSVAVTTTVSMGGTGGSGGAGGEVLVALGGTLDGSGNFTADPAGSAATSITTYGDYANGIMAQSIGGGGGDAGFGAGNTQSFGTGSSTSISVTLGSQGGAGGDGGQIYAYIGPGDGITTWGSGSVGLLAQSIGGGGGTSQGGSYSLAQTIGTGQNSATLKPSVTVNLGLGSTATGGNGGNLNIDVAAPITTHGGDAVGVLAQSIGGGGGTVGSAGSDGSADNPIVATNNGYAEREFSSEVSNFLQNVFQGDNDGSNIPSIDTSFTLSIGGTGAQGGTGGNVEVAISAPITTSGDWASGVVAQSIGGGGGKGGTAAATGTGGLPEITINSTVALGGSGGSGNNGREVLIDLQQGDAVIQTAGYAASGIIAQSVGGGGGMGADGSDSATGIVTLGQDEGGNAGSGGAGGPVQLEYGDTNGSTVATTGVAADAIILQSVGGGGGIGGAGSSLFAGATQQSTQWELTAGGNSGSGGDGGTVLVRQGATDAILNVSTTGAYSIGLLAQSIGGGGGLISVQPTAETVTANLGGDMSSGNGGEVTINASNVNLSTQGVAAHGIVAQSIGGGGGYIRVNDTSTTTAAATPSLTATWNASDSNSLTQGTGSGGDVNITLIGGGVTVSGAGAVGILAQSLGGGGGILVSDGSIFAGSAASTSGICMDSCTGGGDVTVIANGNVSATGTNGIGLFAQSQGTPGYNGTVAVTVAATVTGGSGTAATTSQSGAAGVWIDGDSSANSVTVNTGATLTTGLGTSGTAILQTGGGVTTVNNSGTVTGAAYLNGGTFNNVNGGTHNTGSINDGDVANDGVLNIGLFDEIRATHVTGDFVQTSNGRLGVTIHSLAGSADRLEIDGSAVIGGVIVPTVISLLPGTVPVVTATSMTSSAQAQDSLLFDWDAEQRGNTLTLTPHSDFTPAGVALNRSQLSLANYFTRAWDNADAAFATQFADMSGIGTATGYTTMLNQLSGQDIQAQSLALANSAGSILGASMSCPVFVGNGVLLGEDNCSWATISGRWTDQDTTRDIQGYEVDTTSYRIGAQHEIAPEWYLGGSFAYGDTSSSTDNGSWGDGYTLDGSVALKHVKGPWFVAGSLAMAYGSFDSYRRINLPFAAETLESDPSIFLVGGRLRAGYEFTRGDWYLRPYGDVDLFYTNLPGVTEAGTSIYALDVEGSSKTNVQLSLMMEVGGRLNLDAATTLRPYASVGVSYLPDNTRTFESSFINATANNGTFLTYIETPEVLGRLDLGLQYFRANGIELKVGYTADIGEDYLSQSASVRFAYHF